jgi:acyl-CoA reductase-like NAD-dependent aldehyde dehydrogenase
VDEAVAAASAAFPMWSGLQQAAARSHFLRQVGQLFREQAEELSTLEMCGIGAIISRYAL